jgi:Peptidase C13 family
VNIENCRRRWVQRMSPALVLVAAALLSGCAYLTPRSEPALAQSQALQSQQHQQAQALLAQSSAPRLWFAGFALHSQSMAFQGDLDAAHALFTRQFPPTIALRFSNELRNRSLRYPFATVISLRGTLAYIGQHAHAQDRVVLFLTSHGVKGSLNVNIGGTYFPAVRAADLAQWLEPLGDRPTLIVLSACHSGSFIPALARANRIIYAAASAERNSFGCSFTDRITFFVEEFLVRDFDAQRSLQQLFDAGRIRIAERERKLNYQPSEPSSSVGAAVRAWAETPLTHWLKPAAASHARAPDAD